MASDLLNSVAAKAAKHYAHIANDAEAALDPTVVHGIVDLILQLLEAFQACRNPAGLIKSAKSPTWLEKWIINVKVRREMGRRNFRKHGPQMVDAILKTASEMRLEDMQRLYDEV